MPRTHRDVAEAVLINTAGGMTGGDKYRNDLTIKGSQLTVTSQTAERIYKSNRKPAEVSTLLNVSERSVMHWLPQETIFFNNARLARNIELHMSSDSECLISESIVLGRHAMGENLSDCSISDNWRIYREDELVHSEALRIKGDVPRVLHSTAGLGGARIVTTILYLGPKTEQLAERLGHTLNHYSSNLGISCWSGKLIVRLAAQEVSTGKKDTVALLCKLRQRDIPRVWQT
jgi:urease accessory protein